MVLPHEVVNKYK